MKKNDSNLFYTCSLIELIGRTTRQKRKDVVNLMGEKIIRHIYHHADTLHCEPIAKIADYYIDFCHIPTGEFDNIASCKYSVPSYWEIGKVYARLIEDIQKDDVIFALIRVYNSTVSDSISYYNSDFFYQPRGFIKEQFLSEENAVSGETSKKPAIRFRGFTDAWEQRKLREYLETSQERNSGGLYGREDVLSVSGDLGVVNQIEFQGRSFAGASVANYGVVHTHDVVYTKSPLKASPYGIIKANKGKPGIVSTLYAVYRPLQEVTDSDFVQCYFEQGERLNSYLHPLVNKGAKNDMKVSDDNALNGDVIFPSLPEQREISAFLSKIDDLITLHQRKHEKMVSIKKAMLEKLFPKNGSNFPEIRFSGFTDAWEQRKLAFYLETSTEKNTEGVYSTADVLSVSGDFGVVNQIEFQGRSFAGATVTNYGILHPGDVVYTKSPLKASPFGIIKTNKGKTGIVSVLYGVYHPRENLHSDLVQTYFEQNARLNNYLRPLVNKGAKNTLLISDDDALQGDVIFPSQKAEQEKICLLFRNLDRLITLHQRELEKLRNIKKACLEKMFV